MAILLLAQELDLLSALHCVDMLWAGKEFLKCLESL